jgi:hypothetical protein
MAQQKHNPPSPDKFFERAETIRDINPQSSDWFSYSHFLNWFKNRKFLTEKQLAIASYFTYGWMPRTLKIRATKMQIALDAINDVLKNNVVEKKHHDSIKNILNESYIGSSKLLHFAKPDLMPIYDSKVAIFCFGTSQGYNNYDWFDKYKKYVDKLKVDKRADNLRKNLSNEVGFEITVYRALEYAMYVAE